VSLERGGGKILIPCWKKGREGGGAVGIRCQPDKDKRLGNFSRKLRKRTDKFHVRGKEPGSEPIDRASRTKEVERGAQMKN